MSNREFIKYSQSPEMVCFFGKTAIGKERHTLFCCHELMQTKAAAYFVYQNLELYMQAKNIPSLAQLKPFKPPTCIFLFPNDLRITDTSSAAESLITLLLNLHQLDVAREQPWAEGVSNDPHNQKFSFSVHQEAFFIPFLYPNAYAPARRSPIPALVFNAHRFFTMLIHQNTYDQARDQIRSKEMELFGFVPELLANFGQGLEFPQYVLPPELDLPIIWDTLYKLGGEHPFGSSNDII